MTLNLSHDLHLQNRFLKLDLELTLPTQHPLQMVRKFPIPLLKKSPQCKYPVGNGHSLWTLSPGLGLFAGDSHPGDSGQGAASCDSRFLEAASGWEQAPSNSHFMENFGSLGG
jgi:hypothetical protein